MGGGRPAAARFVAPPVPDEVVRVGLRPIDYNARPPMPLVTIHLRRGKSPEYLRAVADAVHAALVAQANVPADDRFQLIRQYAAEELIAHPSYAGVERTEDLIIIEITLNHGRTLEVKKALFADLAVRLERDPGVRPDDVLVNLVEVPKENWSFGRGVATYG